MVSWSCSNAVLQVATAVNGPWQDVPLDSTQNAYVLTPTNSAGFFRLREP